MAFDIDWDDPDTRKRVAIAVAVGLVLAVVLVLTRRPAEQPTPIVDQRPGQLLSDDERGGGETEIDLDALMQTWKEYADAQYATTQQAIQELGMQMADALGGVYSAMEEMYYSAGEPVGYDYEGVGYYGGVSTYSNPTKDTTWFSLNRFVGPLLGALELWERVKDRFRYAGEVDNVPTFERKRPLTPAESARFTAAWHRFRAADKALGVPAAAESRFAAAWRRFRAADKALGVPAKSLPPRGEVPRTPRAPDAPKKPLPPRGEGMRPRLPVIPREGDRRTGEVPRPPKKPKPPALPPVGSTGGIKPKVGKPVGL